MIEQEPNGGSNDRSDSPGGQPQEAVEDRPNVSTVKPEDYPDRAESVPGGAGSGTQSPPGLDEEKDYERLNPGSSHSTPDGSGPGSDGEA
jgi:hypothetical protein